MYAISTAVFVSILALASSLAVVVRAGDPRVQCIQKEHISTHINCDTLLQALGIDIVMFQLMNPNQSCDGIIASGSVCIVANFPDCAYRATAGDTDNTCDRLAAANHITKQQFIDYNDDVNADVNADCPLVVGNVYCISVNN